MTRLARCLGYAFMFLFALTLGGSRAYAQSGSYYCPPATYASDGSVTYASCTYSASMTSATCQHQYTASLGLSGPNGLVGSSDYNGTVSQSTAWPFTETINDQISSVVAGSYYMSRSASAYCSCVQYTFYQLSLLSFLVTPPPYVSGVQVNGVLTNTIVAGTSGYMSIYGLHFDGATSVSAPPGVTITSFSVYNGNQINAYFQSAANAATGTHDVSVVTNHGTSTPSNGSKTTTVSVNMTKFVFTDSISYSRDCAGAASLISSPTWPAPTGGVVCPQKLGYTGDHAVYVSGATMHGTVTFSVSPAPSQGVAGMYVQGAIPGVGNFTASGVSIAAGTATFSASVAANAALPSTKTQFYDPMNIQWSLAQSGTSCSSSCAAVGNSSNPLYVSLGKPLAIPQPLGPLLLTYVALAVGNGGAVSPPTAVSNTWGLFSSSGSPSNIKTWDGRPMYYYSRGFNSCATGPSELVETSGTPAGGSGQCGAFAFLLEVSLSVNGIQSNWINVSPQDAPSTQDKMVIKKWDFGLPSYPSSAPWVYKLILGISDYMYPSPPSYGDLINDQPMLYGQNTAPPVEKVFDFHFIVQIPIVSGNQYYDPSYGVTYANEADFESRAVAGYAKQIPGVDTGGYYHLRLPAQPVNIIFTPVKANSI